MKRCLAGLTALLACSAVLAFFSDSVRLDQLPKEARHTLQLIDAGGPFPYKRDGITFQNREKRLPLQPKGYYREYTVPTPGEATRGARRIVAGGQPPEVTYYTADHYRTFKKVIR